MTTSSRARLPLPVAAAMLLAVMALVFHGAVRVLAHPVGTHAPHAAHSDCADHTQGSADRHAGHHAGSGVGDAAGPDGPPQPQHQGWQFDCCTAVAAVVLPALVDADLRILPSSRGVAPAPSALLEGLPPPSPSKPPRTRDQG